MNFKAVIALGWLMIFMGVARSDDHLLDGDGGADNNSSPLTQTSHDHRLRITLLYVGPVKDKQFASQSVVVYLLEDLRTDEEYERHHITFSKEGYETGGGEYSLSLGNIEIKDGTHRLLTDNKEERCRQAVDECISEILQLYPNARIPKVENPKRSGIYEWFYVKPATGPFDVTVHDSFPAYGENNFRFNHVDFPPVTASDSSAKN